ncbi:MAG: TadG family pilus assembly protein [Hyphomonadaceae bacterium]|nr:TadG family pilus assembly protein [Hyphomonadaceae bacterium]
MRTLARDRRGNVALIAALCGTGFIGAAGLAVDSGSVYLETRRVQGAADLAAIAAATALNPQRAHQTVQANLGRGTTVSVTFGDYTPDPARHARDRFSPGGPDTDAARVTVESRAPLFFGAAILGKESVAVRRTATAAQSRMGAFTLGTRLAAVRGGLANALLSGLTGSSVSLSVMDYNALLDADVSLFHYFDALRADLDLTAVTYDDLLEQEVEAGRALSALSATLAGADRAAEAGIVANLAAATKKDHKVKLGNLVDLGPYGAQDQAAAPLDITVAAFDLANMVLQGANGGRHIELDIPNLGAPGIGDVTAWLAIGDPQTGSAWLVIGPEGVAQVRTAQARLYVDARILSAGLAPLRLPLLVELASAEARLSDVRCGGAPSAHRMEVEVRPALATVQVADIDLSHLKVFTRELPVEPAQVLRLPAVRLTAEAKVRLGSKDWRAVTFSGREIEEHAIKTVASRGFAKGLASSVMEDLELDAQALGLSLSPVTKTLTVTAGAALTAAAPALDGVIEGLLATAGLSLGEADVQASGVRCMPAVLVG